MKALLVIVTILIPTMLLGQDKLESYNLILKFTPIYGNHSSDLVKFPVGYSDAQINPRSQEYSLGYDGSISVLRKVGTRLRLGLTGYYSHFGFTEYGEELSFWSNELTNYTIAREFNLLGFGVQSGYILLMKKSSRLTINTGLCYEFFTSKKGVYLWRETENRNKYTFSSSLDYSHKIKESIDLIVGLNTRLSLKKYFSYIEYQPSRFGVNVGIAFKIN